MKRKILFAAMLFSVTSVTQATELLINGVPVESIQSTGDIVVNRAKGTEGKIWTITNGANTYRIHRGAAAVLAELETLRNDPSFAQPGSKATYASMLALDEVIDGVRRDMMQSKDTVSQTATGLCYTASLDLTANFGRTFWTSNVYATFTQGMAPGPPAPTQNYIHVWARAIDNNPGGLTYEGYDSRGPFANTTGQTVNASAYTGLTNGAINHELSAWGYFQAIGCDHYLFSVVPTWQ